MTKYDYPANATQAQKAKIRREARAAAKAGNEPKAKAIPQSDFEVAWVDPVTEEINYLRVPEGLAYQMTLRDYQKHGNINYLGAEDGITQEITKKWKGWSWLKQEEEAPKDNNF